MYSPDKIEEKHHIYKKQRENAAVVLQRFVAFIERHFKINNVIMQENCLFISFHIANFWSHLFIDDALSKSHEIYQNAVS